MSKTWLLLASALALAGLVLYLLWRSEEDALQTVSAPATDASPDASDTAQAQTDSEDAHPRLEAARRELELPGPEPAEVGDLYRIRVTSKSTGEPVPGARVSYYEESVSRLATRRRGVGDEDHEAEALDQGRTVYADSEGIALVAVEQRIRITGRHEKLYGERLLDAVHTAIPGQEQEYELVLEPDPDFGVRVVDFRGEPAPGITVGFARVSEGPVTWLEAIGTSSEDGRVDERQLRLRLPSGTSKYVLRPMIPGFVDGGVTFDPADLPDEPIDLRLPPTGRVLVRLTDARGDVLPRFPLNMVLLAMAGDEIPEAAGGTRALEWRAGRYEGGTAIFEHVVIGKSYRARSGLRIGWAEGIFAGPRQQGDEVLFDLRMEQGYYGLAGRILDEHGHPIAGTRVSARYESEAAVGRASFETDPDGLFWVFLRPAERDTDLAHLSFERAGAAPLRSAPILGGILMLGTNDLGDVVLAKPERKLVGSGRLLVDGEPPASWPEGNLGVSGWDPVGERWLRVRRIDVTEGHGGRFEIHTFDAVDRYRLEYTPLPRTPYLPPPAVEFRAGARDLELTLQSSGSLVAKVRTAGMPPLDDLWLRLMPLEGQFPDVDPTDGPGSTRSPRANPLYARPGDRAGDLQPFRWQKLWPGGYRLEALARGNRSLLLVVPGIVIRQGPNDDPRLQGIDLGGALREIHVTLTDPAGQGISGAVFLQDPATDLHQAYLTQPDQPATILVSDPYVDLLVAAPGYRPDVVEGVAADMHVTLEPNPEVLVRITGDLPEMEAERVLEVSVESEQPADERRYNDDQGGGGRLDSYLRPKATTARFEGNREVVVQTSGAGSHRIALSVVNTILRRTQPIAGVEPSRFELTGDDGQILELHIPAEGLAEALKRVRVP